MLVKILRAQSGKPDCRQFGRSNTSHTGNRRETLLTNDPSIQLGNAVQIAADGFKEGEAGPTSRRISQRVEENPKPSKQSGFLDFTLPSEGARQFGGKKAEIEKLWREFFSEPSEWCDHRLDNVNSKFPTFKHKKQARKALWLDSVWMPPWAKGKLAALPPGTVQLSNFSWNERLLKCAQAGQYEKTMELFQLMQRHGNTPDRHTFFPVLKACSSLGLLEHGRNIHAMMQPGLEADPFIGNSLVDMYAKCGRIEEAESVFNRMHARDVVAWTAMIVGFVKCGEGQKALELFDQMLRHGVHPNHVTFIGVLNACASIAALGGGRHAHKEIIRRGYECGVTVGNSLVDMYTKCGSIEEAERVFNQMPTRNVVGWTAMIVGYVKCGEGQKALELFEQMQRQGVNPNQVTFNAVLNACASVAALEEGRQVHEEIIRRGYESNVFVGNSLVDMYAKCGCIEEAEIVFNRMPTKNIVCWTAMMHGYGIHGYARKAVETFERMRRIEEVNSVTLLTLLSACSHGGLVDEGVEYFNSMSVVYNISPRVNHFVCVVDLLGRAGRLYESKDLIMSMPMQPVGTVWLSLLSACRLHSNTEVGECCAKHVLELDPKNSSAYFMLSEIYVAAGKWESRARVRQEKLDKGLKDRAGCAWIEANSKVHSFLAKDSKHPQIMEIQRELKTLSGQMKEIGSVLDTRFELLCMDEERKEFYLCHHSEMLAVVFGLISTASGTTLHIVKNLQMCGNCHSTTKFISKTVGRAIIVRDANRIHHIEDGLCSCEDYW